MLKSLKIISIFVVYQNEKDHRIKLLTFSLMCILPPISANAQSRTRVLFPGILPLMWNCVRSGSTSLPYTYKVAENGNSVSIRTNAGRAKIPVSDNAEKTNHCHHGMRWDEGQ